MAFQAAKDGEPIAGYRLLQRLGTGGYGEVWSATAPGGLTKAIKFVYGNIDAAQAEQELKALSRIREVRHPFLLSLERFEIIDNQLMIVTELAEMSLFDCFQKFRNDGYTGIPREELLVYIGDAADALDYMHEKYGLQHLDIKPQNLLLVGGRIKVADFGLVKDLKSTSATATGGVTPVYATPEAFDGRVSQHSDQYSLAIVYQEMLSGVRPFPGTTALQLAVQHMYSPPMLDPLPPTDRPIIARALAKVPDERFHSCREMISGLRAAAAPVIVTTGNSPAQAVDDLAFAIGAPSAEESEFDPTQVGMAPAHPGLVTPSDMNLWTVGGPQRLDTAKTVRLRPTLFLGLGGLAGRVLCRLKGRLLERFESQSHIPILQTLLLDTDNNQLQLSRGSDKAAALDVDDTLLVPLHPPEHYRTKSKELLRWIDRRWFFGIPRSLLTDGVRALGRLAVIENGAEVLDRIRGAIARLGSPRAKSETAAATGMSLREQSPRVFVIASLCGGTGSGMLIDAAYCVRRVLLDLNVPTDGLTAILLYATGRKPGQKELARANSFATLRELAHFSSRRNAYEVEPGGGLPAAKYEDGPFEDTYVVQLGDDLDDAHLDAGADLVAEYLYLDAASVCGTLLDGYRRQTHIPRSDGPTTMRVRSFGLHRLAFPRLRLARACAELICRRLVDRWRGQSQQSFDASKRTAGVTLVPAWNRAIDSDPMHDEMRKVAHRWTQQIGLEQEAIEQRLAMAAGITLGKNFDAVFGEMVGELRGYELSIDTIQAFLQRVRDFLGGGSASDEFRFAQPSPAEKAVAEQAREAGDEVGLLMVEWIGRQSDDPHRRLRGAQYATDWLAEYIPTAIQRATDTLDSLRRDGDVMLRDIASKDSKGRWFGRSRPSFESIENELLSYCRNRLRQILVHNSLAVFRATHGKLSLSREHLALLRRRLDQFAECFDVSSVVSRQVAVAGSHVTELYPRSAKELGQAASALLDHVGNAFLDEFDEATQSEVIASKGGLLAIDFDNVELREKLRAELLRRANDAALKETEKYSAASLFFESHASDDQARQLLHGYLKNAQPHVTAQGSWKHLLLAVPDGAEGDKVRDIVADDLKGFPTTISGGNPDRDVIACIEAAGLPLGHVASFLTDNRPEFVQLASKMLTRKDINWDPLT